MIGVPVLLDGIAQEFLDHRITRSGDSAAAWRPEDFPNIGLSVDLPGEGMKVVPHLDDGTRKSVASFEEYAGASGVLDFDIGRCKMKLRKDFTPELYFAGVLDKLGSTPGVTDLRPVRGDGATLAGGKSYVLTCTLKIRGVATRMHHEVRVGQNELLFVQGWFALERASQGEAAWDRMRNSIEVRPFLRPTTR